MSATLTDRYVSETIRHLPQPLQQDVRAELETSISDAVDDRIEQGEARDDAERRVLTDLGDPAVLAAGYADRPLQLIGPKYYLVWWRLLKLLWAIVPAVAFGGVAIGQALDGAGVGQIIGQGIAVALSVVVHIGFWTTLVFAVLERTGADTGVQWSIDQLPEERPSGAARTDLIGSLVMLAFFAGALLWDHFRGFVPGDRVLSIINPELWPWWMGLLFLLMLAEAALAIAVYVRGRWTMALAWVNFAIAVSVMSLGLTALGRGVLYNPEFVTDVFTMNGVDSDATTVLAVLTGLGIAGVCIGDMVDGWLKARRAEKR
ncbi:hypothetical protein DY023_11705 [Microbacterium bovistercoris]|uniref:Uncharacterized protein n=1 Tax=Microbacterium bovistercoris TaxID=2293570 RepID=A0A371NRU2_9MICO|nr:permease prefix domain 1-containing protein [Microbacterium bovistercoris]REJ04917.1 hypothetical protein DY023_11705 [Microbacterium bovistercoris]